MFGFSMIQMIRQHAYKLDREIRDELLHVYKPFRWTPCFLHKGLERLVKGTKRYSVIVEFKDKECFLEGMGGVSNTTNRHLFCRVKADYPSISCCSALMTPAALDDLLNSCSHVKKIYLDREVKALLNVATPSSKAENVVRNNKELTGENITIAIIDTGIHPHKDLEGRLIDFKDFINNRETTYDDNGHGTHCAGDAAGNGEISGGKYVAPAPKANLIGVKVLDKLGSGSLSTVMEGVQWCMDYNELNPEKKIHIISMSLGSSAQKYEQENDDPMVKIVEEAWRQGIVVCVAAGNEGPGTGTIASPGISDKVITVGAMDDKETLDRLDDSIASFSSRGPTIYDKQKPDVVAPGVNIVSLRSPNSYLDKLQKNNRVDNDYFVLSGTSMATPICAGIVALMLENKPNLTPDGVKLNLLNGADPWEDDNHNKYGAGYINAERSI
jgi:serine protease AprX